MVYMGSKNRIAKFILPFINEAIKKRQPDYYIEPFMGGCNMMDKVNYPRRIASDYNKYLVALFQGLIDGRRVKKQISKTEYLKFKKTLDLYDDFTIGWYGIFFSFNGSFLDSYGGKARTHDGKTSNRAITNIKNALRQIPKLQGVEFHNRSYEFYSGYKNCVFYLDPPYANTAGYKAGEKNFNHTVFWDFARKLSENNDVYISEYTAPDDFSVVWEMNVGLVGVGLTAGANKHIEKLFKYG